MAQRPIFIPQARGDAFVLTESIEFKWIAGMAVSQKQKSINSLHEAAYKRDGIQRILEISSKSREELGVKLSAFNLIISPLELDDSMSVECAFQGSKIFEHGGPYTDMFYKNPRDAKRDERLQTSGRLTAFKFFNEKWPLNPQTVFYDWLYISALQSQHVFVLKNLFEYDAFTDIEFNPKKSINCQAYSVALYVALHKRGLLKEALSSRDNFIECVKSALISNARQNDNKQGNLF